MFLIIQQHICISAKIGLRSQISVLISMPACHSDANVNENYGNVSKSVIILVTSETIIPGMYDNVHRD